MNLLSGRKGRILQIRIDQTFSIFTFWTLDDLEEGQVVSKGNEEFTIGTIGEEPVKSMTRVLVFFFGVFWSRVERGLEPAALP